MQKLSRLFFAASALLALTACGSNSDEANKSSPSLDHTNWSLSRKFVADGKTYSPADFDSVNLAYTFNLATQIAQGHSEIDFHATASGLAYFLSDPTITAAELDGVPVGISQISDPDKLNTLQVVPVFLTKGSAHHLRLDFTVPSAEVSFDGAGVGFLTSMSDLIPGNYLEAYAPASFENDEYHLRMNLKIDGTPAAHTLFSNGVSQQLSANEWQIDFPSYFTSSSFYVHLTHQPFVVRTGSYQGVNALIPITVYSRDATLADKAMQDLPGLFAELEATYGPYAHPTFTAYIAGKGGMEYSGATITSNSALGHELTHSWFARGVMPSSGSSGWIDEAIASWRDYDYFRATSTGVRAPTNLGRFSAFERFAPHNVYVDGRALLAEFDFLMANQGGLRPVLRQLFAGWDHRTIRTEDFKEFLEQKSGLDLTNLFQRYIYAADASFPGDGINEYRESPFHPMLSRKEIEKLR